MARLIADAPDKMRRIPLQLDAKGRQKRCLNRPSKEPKPKSFYAQYPDHWFALDTIVRCRDGMRGYILTAINLDSRIAVAVATNSPHQLNCSGQPNCNGMFKLDLDDISSPGAIYIDRQWVRVSR